MSATTEKVRELLGSRITELDEERDRVQNALEALGSTNGRNGSSGRLVSPTLPPRRKRRRNRVGGTRADQAVELIKKTPGISASGIAKAMKIKPNYLYRLLGDLEREGVVKKDGRRYTLAG